MKNVWFTTILLLSFGLLLTACIGNAAAFQPAPSSSTATLPPLTNPAQQNEPSVDLKRTDTQGAVTLDVNPLNFTSFEDTLIFDVSMNTHSVDLSMDLAALSELATNNGLTLPAAQWDAPKGGHHVEGTLTFAIPAEAKSVLQSAKEWTLTIKSVDAPTRVFTWQILQ